MAEYRIHSTIPREKRSNAQTALDHVKYGIDMISGVSEGKAWSKTDRSIHLGLAYESAEKAKSLGTNPWILLEKLRPYKDELKTIREDISLLLELEEYERVRSHTPPKDPK